VFYGIDLDAQYYGGFYAKSTAVMRIVL